MNIVKYFTYLTGLIPTEDEKKLLIAFTKMDINKIIISAGRQSGKTLTTAVAILWWIFESGRKVKILLLSAQDNILYYHIREIFKNHPEFEPQIVAQGISYLQYLVFPKSQKVSYLCRPTSVFAPAIALA